MKKIVLLIVMFIFVYIFVYTIVLLGNIIGNFIEKKYVIQNNISIESYEKYKELPKKCIGDKGIHYICYSDIEKLNINNFEKDFLIYSVSSSFFSAIGLLISFIITIFFLYFFGRKIGGYLLFYGLLFYSLIELFYEKIKGKYNKNT